jgi:hypothetical protein
MTMSNHATTDDRITATPIFDELRDEIGIDLADLLPQTPEDQGEGKEIRAVG